MIDITINILYNMLNNLSINRKEALCFEKYIRERERARRRMLSGKSVEPSGNISLGSKGQSRDKVAAAVGLGSGRTYDKAKKVWEAAKAQKQGCETFRNPNKGRATKEEAS
jgi:hypothetical protein